MSKKYIIDESLVLGLLKYLGTRPHSEVRDGVDGLEGLEEALIKTDSE